MSEKIPSFENKEPGPESWFGLLDIIKIDGRWAQIISGVTKKKDDSTTPLVHYLDDNSISHVNFQEYELSRHLDTRVATILKTGELSADEFKNVHWDSDNIGTEMSLWVHVFGEFEKKTSSDV